MATVADPLPVALEQALALFEPERRPARARLRDGYLDLVDEDDPGEQHLAQRMMLNRVVPRIYERLWRPAAMLAAAGRGAPKRREEYRTAVQMLELSKGDRVLDIACGTGAFSRSFAEATGDGLVVGLDISRPMLAAATRRTTSANLAFIRGDAYALPFQVSSFDAICCFGALHMLQHPMRALDEIVGVLAPGGRVAIMTTCDDDSTARRDRPPVRKYGGMLMFTRDEITGALGDRGLLEIDQRVIGNIQFVSMRKSQPEGATA